MKNSIQTELDGHILTQSRQWSELAGLGPSERELLRNLIHRAEIGDSKACDELTNLFYKDLEFGTAGMRSVVGAGPNGLNTYTIGKASYAFALTLKKHFPKITPKIVISYDSRLTSAHFAKLTSMVFAHMGLEVYCMPRETATPILSYGVRYFQAQGGIMITASHNPSDYNGYKVYWDDGAQVSPPYDQEIIDQYYATDFTNAEFTKVLQCVQDELSQQTQQYKIQMIHDDFYQSYYHAIASECLRPELIEKHGDKLKILYTPLHGTGAEPVSKLFQKLGFQQFRLVQEQAKPDGHFPTTSRPNPEEHQALALGEQSMLQSHDDLLIGSDPDTDRMGVIINHRGKPYFLNGNETAVLLLYYKLSTLQEQDRLPSDAIVIKTLVTSPLQNKIAKNFGATVYDTFTGFKWMAKVIKQLEQSDQPFSFIMASEESFGSMSHVHVRDKDGISAAALISEAALHYKLQDKTLIDVLHLIYKEYGLHREELINKEYPGKIGMEKIQHMMQYFRQGCLEKLGNYQITDRYDFAAEKRSDDPYPDLQGNLIKLTLDHKHTLFLRPSGTEPKIKFYIQMSDLDDPQQAQVMRDDLDRAINTIAEQCQ